MTGSIPLQVEYCGQLLVGLLIAGAVLRIYRQIRSTSALAASIVAAGLIIRGTLGSCLFWTSYLNLPWLRSLHTGDGFWALMPDAYGYSSLAAGAALHGLGNIQPGDPSPSFVWLLAIWMRGVGIGPASGMFLNLTCYALTCWLVVKVFRLRGNTARDLPGLLLLAALTFSPVLLVHGTQPLKDELFACLIALGCAGAFAVLAFVLGERRVSQRGALAGLAMLAAAIFMTAGIRTYFAFLAWCSLGAGLLAALILRRTAVYRQGLPLAMGVITAVGVAYVSGAGIYETYMTAAVGVIAPSATKEAGLAKIERYRRGYESLPGNTSLAAVSRTPAAPSPPLLSSPPTGGKRRGRLAGDVPSSPTDRAAAIAESGPADMPFAESHPIARLSTGLAAMVVPISLLRALSVVDFAGGRGLLLGSDLDTLFLDATILASLILLYLRWDTARPHLPYIWFALVLAGVTAGLMAYIVSNYGTLLRLRVMPAVVVWMVALALRPSAPETELPTAP